MTKKQTKKKKKSRITDFLDRQLSWHYYKDNQLPINWNITITDVTRWRKEMSSRFPDFKFMTKFRELLDENHQPVLGTQEMAFWFESSLTDALANECENPEEHYVDDFYRLLNPREWTSEEEALSWFPIEAFINEKVLPDSPERDRTEEWGGPPDDIWHEGDDYKWGEKSPILEFLETYPSQDIALNS